MGSGNSVPTNCEEYRCSLLPSGPKAACCLARRFGSTGSASVDNGLDASGVSLFSAVAFVRLMAGTLGDGGLKKGVCGASSIVVVDEGESDFCILNGKEKRDFDLGLTSLVSIV